MKERKGGKKRGGEMLGYDVNRVCLRRRGHTRTHREGEREAEVEAQQCAEVQQR